MEVTIMLDDTFPLIEDVWKLMLKLLTSELAVQDDYFDTLCDELIALSLVCKYWNRIIYTPEVLEIAGKHLERARSVVLLGNPQPKWIVSRRKWKKFLKADKLRFTLNIIFGFHSADELIFLEKYLGNWNSARYFQLSYSCLDYKVFFRGCYYHVRLKGLPCPHLIGYYNGKLKSDLSSDLKFHTAPLILLEPTPEEKLFFLDKVEKTYNEKIDDATEVLEKPFVLGVLLTGTKQDYRDYGEVKVQYSESSKLLSHSEINFSQLMIGEEEKRLDVDSPDSVASFDTVGLSSDHFDFEQHKVEEILKRIFEFILCSYFDRYLAYLQNSLADINAIADVNDKLEEAMSKTTTMDKLAKIPRFLYTIGICTAVTVALFLTIVFWGGIIM